MSRFQLVSDALRGVVLATLCATLYPAEVALAAADEASQAFSHAAWSRLLGDCVAATPDGASTAVNYRCMAEHDADLAAYLDALAAVEQDRFARWNRDQRLAFLINAYNAWTVRLILEHYPGLESIRDIGGLLSSPWKRAFIPLLGETRSLDEIEHGMIRARGRYDEPRIHFAVNCASIGCPALRREAYVGTRLEGQLEEQTGQFLADRSRNGLRRGRLELSPLFKWYREDFEQAWRGGSSLGAFVARYARALSLSDAQRQQLLDGDLRIRFGDYDWRLNDATP